MTVSVAHAALEKVQTQKTRWSVRRYQQRFAHRDGGQQRLHTLVFARSPTSWHLQK